jgi:ribosome biogenesis protein Nip4
MKDIETFRYINKIEKTMIANSFLKISLKLSPVFKEIEKFLYIFISDQTSQKNYPKIYLFSERLDNFIQNIKSYLDIYSGGLYFGFIKKGEFYFSLEGAEYFYKKGLFLDFKQLYANENGEKSILYGNNISKNMIAKKPAHLKKKDFLLIFNKLNEIIAIAQSLVDNISIQKLESKDTIAFNLTDKGYYLRKSQ